MPGSGPHPHITADGPDSPLERFREIKPNLSRVVITAFHRSYHWATVNVWEDDACGNRQRSSTSEHPKTVVWVICKSLSGAQGDVEPAGHIKCCRRQDWDSWMNNDTVQVWTSKARPRHIFSLKYKQWKKYVARYGNISIRNYIL